MHSYADISESTWEFKCKQPQCMRNTVLIDGGIARKSVPSFYINTLRMITLIISRYMKKLSNSHPLANTYIYMYVAAAMTLVYVLTLFIQAMTYDKEARIIAGHDYVREVTRWPGHVRIINIPVEYAQEHKYTLSKCVYL